MKGHFFFFFFKGSITDLTMRANHWIPPPSYLWWSFMGNRMCIYYLCGVKSLPKPKPTFIHCLWQINICRHFTMTLAEWKSVFLFVCPPHTHTHWVCDARRRLREAASLSLFVKHTHTHQMSSPGNVLTSCVVAQGPVLGQSSHTRSSFLSFSESDDTWLHIDCVCVWIGDQ